MATKNNPGTYDCYANAEPDEPIFVLLGRDKHAPVLVWLWATLRKIDGEDPKKVAEAAQCCIAMCEWLASKGKKACGLANAGLASVYGLAQFVNEGFKESKYIQPTDLERIREFMLSLKE